VDILTSYLDAVNDITVTATAGYVNIESTDVTSSAGAIDINANTDATILGSTLISATDTTVDATTGSIVMESTDVTAGGLAALTAAVDVDILDSTITAQDSVTVTAQGGSVDITNSVLTSANDIIDINAQINADITDSTLTADGDITVDAATGYVWVDTTDMTSTSGAVGIQAATDTDITDSTLTAATNVTIGATAGTVDIESSTVTATTGQMDVTAGDDIMVSRSDLDAGTTMSLTAANNVDMLYTTANAVDGIDVTGTAGYVNLDAVQMAATSGDVDITAGTNVDIDDSEITADLDLSVVAGNNVDVVRSTLTAGMDISIDALGGYVNLNTVDADAGSDIDIYALTNVDIINTLLTALDDIDVVADTGYIRICLDSVLDAGDDVYLEAGTDIIICENAQVIAGDDATLVAGNDVYLGYVEAGDEASVTAGGAIYDNNDDNLNILAQDIILSAVNGIGEADAIETQGETLWAQNTTSGDIWIRNNTQVAGDLDILGVTNMAPGGLVRIENGYIRFDNGTLNDIDYGTGGDMLLSGPVQADGRVSLQTIGSILDRNNATPFDVIGTETSEMLAFDGTIGEFDGNPNGSGYNPVEVNINPGDLYVYASDENFFISVAIDGIVQPADVLSVYPGLVPPGLIFFNGRMNGGMRSNQWFRAASPSIVMIGNEQTFWLEVLLKLMDYRWIEIAPAFWQFDEDLDNSLDYIISKR
jgi:hypothetical protein